MADSGKARKRSAGERKGRPEPQAFDPWKWGDAEWDWELPAGPPPPPPRGVCWESERMARRAEGFPPRWSGKEAGLWGPPGPRQEPPAWGRGRGRGPRQRGRGRDPWGRGSPLREEPERGRGPPRRGRGRGRGRGRWRGGSPHEEEEQGEEEEPWRGAGPRRGGRGRDEWGRTNPPNEEEEEEPPRQEEAYNRRSRWGSCEVEPPSWREQPPAAKAPRRSAWDSPQREGLVRQLLTPPRQSSPERAIPHWQERGWGEWDSPRHGVPDQPPPQPSSPHQSGDRWDEPEMRARESPGRGDRGWESQSRGRQPDEAPWGSSQPREIADSLDKLSWEQGSEQWRNPARGKDVNHAWGSSPSFQRGWSADRAEEEPPEAEEEPDWDTGENESLAGPPDTDAVPFEAQKWTPRPEVVDFWAQECCTCLSLRQRRQLMSFCPRPMLPDKMHVTPALNADFAHLAATSSQKQLLAEAKKLGWLQDEVLDMLAPAMSIYEVAEVALEKQEPLDPLEVREGAQHLLRLLGSLSNRLTLHRRLKVLRAIHPRLQSICSKMSSCHSDGKLFAEDKVQLLKELLARFPQLSTHKRTRRHRKHKACDSNPPQGAGSQDGMVCFKEEFQQTHIVSQGIWGGQLDQALNWPDVRF